VINEVNAGGQWKLQHSYINGGFTPLYTFYGGANSWTVNLEDTTLDTFGNPAIAAFSGGTIFATNSLTIGSPTSGIPPITGNAVPIQGVSSLTGTSSFPNANSIGLTEQLNGVNDGTIGTGGGVAWTVWGGSSALATNPSYPVFISGLAPAAPTCTVSAGGSVPLLTDQFVLAPIWSSGGEGTYSLPSNACTTTTGNQTITISWATPAVPGGPKGYNLYYCTSNGTGCTGGYGSITLWGNPQSPTTTSVVWSAPGVGAGTGIAVPSAGPTMMMPGVKGIAAPDIVIGTNTPSPVGSAGVTHLYVDPGNWPAFKPAINPSTAYGILAMPGWVYPSVRTQRVAGCATAASLNATCDVSIPWNPNFNDASYSVECTGDAVTSGVPLVQGVAISAAKTAAATTVRTISLTAAAAQFTAIDCIAIHD
jgi:hypothetical protein